MENVSQEMFGLENKLIEFENVVISKIENNK